MSARMLDGNTAALNEHEIRVSKYEEFFEEMEPYALEQLQREGVENDDDAVEHLISEWWNE